MDKLENLKKKIEEIQTKSLVANDMKAFIQLVLKVISDFKVEQQKLTTEQLNTIQQAISYIEKEYKTNSTSLEAQKSSVLKEIEKKVSEVNSRFEELKTLKVTPGKDGKDGEDGYTPVKGEDYFTEKEIKDIKDSVLNDIPELEPEEIKDKLESLQGDKRLDAKAIKNLPESVVYRGGGVSGIKEIIAGSNITVDNSQLGYPVVATTGLVQGVNTSKITVSATEPASPTLYDLWYDIS